MSLPETSLNNVLGLCETYAVGHLAHAEAYEPDHSPRLGTEAYELAIQYSAGLLSRDSEAAEKFLQDREIELRFNHPLDDPKYQIEAIRGGEVILDRILSRTELTAAIQS